MITNPRRFTSSPSSCYRQDLETSLHPDRVTPADRGVDHHERMPEARIAAGGPDHRPPRLRARDRIRHVERFDPRTHSRSTWIPGRVPLAPLEPEWLIVDHLPMFHRFHRPAAPAADTIVHVHGFGISGTYLEPTAASLASRYPTYVPDLPGMGRSMRPRHGLDLPGLARALVSYLDTVGVEKPILVGNSLGCPVIIELAASFPDRVKAAVLVSPAGGPNNQPLGRAYSPDGPGRSGGSRSRCCRSPRATT